ncbi:MAG TPA: hypothetical protein DEO70_14345 [Bacteroidales bacterium]|nr:MAG: hypothetical protein A2X11_13335 [Bacteroidetes bacterium GWE2_42_24]OFY26747.1 MAG: hypothetical protein A2X09_10100 [Bacteroidetes bacterium GWF2_43_11]HBZ68011.1 hypothetical protein [Bacteroidales bacterium]
MENNIKLIESILDRLVDYGNTSIELIKLRAIDKTTEIFSSVANNSLIYGLIISCMLFLNLGLALWLGELLGRLYYGFFIVAGIYILIVVIVRFIIYKWLKKKINDYFIAQILK